MNGGYLLDIASAQTWECPRCGGPFGGSCGRCGYALLEERPPPPNDVRGGGSFCLYCSVTPEARRCEGCPRPRRAGIVVVGAQERPSRRRRRLRLWRSH